MSQPFWQSSLPVISVSRASPSINHVILAVNDSDVPYWRPLMEASPTEAFTTVRPAEVASALDEMSGDLLLLDSGRDPQDGLQLLSHLIASNLSLASAEH